MNKEISNRIKELRIIKGYTQKEFASLIGVAQTTIANYESGIRVPDTEKLDKIATSFGVTVDYLLGRENNKAVNSTNEIENNISQPADKVYKNFIDYLLKGESEEARSLINNLYDNGYSITSIYLDILEKALKEVGVLWEVGSIDVWKEHFISEVVLDLMRELKLKEKKIKKRAFSLIALTAGAEMHNIGLKMITDILEIEGWRITYIGSNIPVQSIIRAIEFEKTDVIAISVTMPYHIEAAKNAIYAIKNHFGKKAPKIIVGGSAFLNCIDVCKETGADFYGMNIEDIKNSVELQFK